jgi:hypothetical protein
MAMNTSGWETWLRRVAHWCGLACVATAMVACGGGDETTVTPPPVIGSSGGTVSEASGAMVVVPAGALGADTTIRVAMDSTGAPTLPQGLVASGNTYVVTPHGGDFAEPVEVRIPASNAGLLPNEELKLAKAQPGGEWELLADSVLADGVLSARVSSFSFFMPVRVTYLLPIAQLEPLRVTAFNVTCGDQPCNRLIDSPRSFTYSVVTNSGQLPANCSAGALAVQVGTGVFSITEPAEPIALSGGSGTTAAFPQASVYRLVVGLRCGTFALHMARSPDIYWRGQPIYPALEVLRAPAQLDIVSGLGANLDVVLGGGASGLQGTGALKGWFPPTSTNRAVVAWQRSDDNGASWREIAVSTQDEANPNPVGEGVAWRWWGVRHGFVATAADQGALIRVHACYAPPDLAPPPCVNGPATRLNVLQQSALPVIVDAPRSVLVRTGQTASFSAMAGGAPAPAMRWQTRPANATGAWSDVNGSGATTGSYTTGVLSPADNGTQYRVVATNALGSAESAPVTVSVSDLDVAPAITTQPAALSVTAGNDAAFAIAARGTEALSYQWQLNGTPIAGANSPVLRLAAVTHTNAGSYRVVVSNTAGSATSDAAVLSVSAGSAPAVAPSIVTQPVSVSVGTGNTATFAVGVSGSGPIAYQWLRDGQPIGGATAAFYSLAQASGADVASYAVLVSNSAGSMTSEPATLTVGSSAQAVAVTLATQPSPQVQAPGGSATMAVAANGSGPVAYQWLKNGMPLAGATAAVLTLTNLVAEDGASYSVAVSNPLGTVTSDAATLTVLGVPVITTQPAATTGVVGGTASFSVVAGGSGLRYQWLRNGVAIAGAVAASYTTPALALGDSGALYGVLVYNGAGVMFSQSAVLTVTAAPAVTASTLASVVLGGTAAPNNRSTQPSLSADGRLVAFVSDGTNLVAGTTVFGHAYVRNLATQTTTLINARPDGGESSRAVGRLKLAAGGRYAVFTSLANDLVAGDTNLAEDVFRRDLQTGITTRLNVLPDGSQDVLSGNGVGGQLDISADGRWVLFSAGVDLVGDGSVLPNGPALFLRDMQIGSTRALTGIAYGAAALSRNGEYVAVTNGTGSGASAMNHVILHDAEANTTRTVFSMSAANFPEGIYSAPSISDNGHHIAFALRSSTLLGGAASARPQIVVLNDAHLDPPQGLTLESITTAGVVGDGLSTQPILSGDGRYLLFMTSAPNLAGDPAATIRNYVMLRDRQLQTTVVASRRANGSNVWVGNYGLALSGDGMVFACVADMADMVAPGTVGEYQVFVAPRP